VYAKVIVRFVRLNFTLTDCPNYSLPFRPMAFTRQARALPLRTPESCIPSRDRNVQVPGGILMSRAIPTAVADKASRAKARASNLDHLVEQKSDKGEVELSERELDRVSGGISFNYSHIEWSYVQQKPEGSAPGK
jgi:hypothetical protein